ncbi:HotDog domain [Phytophthora cactorum]|nr:HotDog domain [Phytophthora cactorum]
MSSIATSQSRRTVTTTKAGRRTRRVVTTTTTRSAAPMTTTNTPSAEMTKVAAAVTAGKFTFIPEFGGQGSVYWKELQKLYTASKTNTTRAFIDTAAQALLEESNSDEAKASDAFETPIDLHSWLQVEGAPSGLTMSRVFFNRGVSHESVVQNSATALGHSQGVGLRAQETYQLLLTQYKQDGKNIENAGPMLAVRGLKKEHVLKAIEVAKRRTKSPDLHLSLINAADMMNVTGFPATLTLLKQALEGLFAKPDVNQTRIPHSQRKPTGSLSFLPLSAPFHTPLLTEAKPKLVQDVQRVKCEIKGSQLQVPVYATNAEATNLQTVDDVVDELINMQLLELVDWTATWAKIAQHHSNATHILEFGPDLGVAKLSDKVAEGLGIEVVIATAKHPVMSSSATSAPLVGLQQFIDAASTFTSVEATWVKQFGPQVTESGKLVNRFTRALNKPPVMVAGMTPTTSLEGIDLVAAIQNAGFHGELAAGGLSRPNIFEDAVNELVSKIKPGLGIAINMLYLNAKQWGFQFPMVLRMRRSGVPIESITIGAGIPTKERALEMMSQLEAVGIKVVCFKPGSVDGIHAVLEIAEAMPSMSVMLQWTGGRAGGHHSFEDFHQPMEETYAAIRRVSNVLLVVGSGFGNWEDSKQYLTGEWSLARGQLFKMPADGILMGSRVMVAKEAATAPEVKKLLVDTPGIESELEWETSYTGVIGGVITVTSELGEPIHVVANRCTLLWKEFDDKYFSIPRDQVELALRLNKKDIITRLNADYQKPYFGCKRNVETGRAPLLIWKRCLGAQDEPERNGERVHRQVSPDGVDSAVGPGLRFFLDLCRTGGKPVNFVPVIDTEFKTWFKKDSLWYSEDLDAVPERDAQRVFVLQGPVAVRYSTVVDEPVADILNGIATGFANQTVDIANVEVTENEDSVEVSISAEESACPLLTSGWLLLLRPQRLHRQGEGLYARFWVAIEGKEEESCKAACEESVMSPFTAEFSITKKDVVDYRAALGLSDDEEGAPADFSTIVSWRPLIQSVFTKEVKGNLLDLVHLKHSGKIVHGVAIISRKTVDDQMVEVLEPLVELHSEFLIVAPSMTSCQRSPLTSRRRVRAPPPGGRGDPEDQVLAELAAEASVNIGDHLSFELTTKKQYASIGSLSSVEVTGTLFREEAGSNVELGTVEFKSNDANESPVVAFLRQVQPEDAKANGMFSNGGSHMLEKPLEINVPTNALAYAMASRDLNPIHRSKYAAILGHLPKGKPIMHGLWTATKVRDLVVQNFGLGFDSNVVDYDVNFDGMVYPGDKLFMQARHIGLDNGKKVLSVEVVNGSGERVVSARAVVKQAPMAFVFTGQGSAAVGMGMDRYQESSVARDIWNRGDTHLRKTFGFSILDMVRKNPKSITVHFGDTESYSFSASGGLLFATQFSQPALVLLENAMFSEIEAAQLIPDDAYFAGHSLGEYAGLIAFAGALTVEALMDLVFLRGMIMQKSVKRDVEGRSDYGMVATNPTRVGPDFTEEVMHKIVDGIEAASGKLLQVVNFNIQQRQYVVAGENVNLETLSLALTAFKALKSTAVEDVEKVIATRWCRLVLARRSLRGDQESVPRGSSGPMQWKLTSKAQLAHLLVVELLAYQFASPVQWIKTQALLFSEGGVRRFVEIGPAPTLTNMALRTLQVGDFPDVSREILWYQRDREVVHFEEETSNISASEYARGLAAEAAAEAAAAAAKAAADCSGPAPVASAAPAAADAPVAALHVLRVLLAVRLNKELAEIKEDTDVKTLCAGKSAVQNEILGDLEKEFGGGVPEGAGEVPLKELASKFSGYNTLGKVTNGLINKLVASKMPGGFTMSSIKEYLSSEKGLGAGRMESVLAHSLLLAPQARFKSDADARKWLDESVCGYASFAGVSLDRPTMAATPGAVGMSFNPAPVSIPTVSDKPVEAKHALLVMLAAKFGKSFSEIPETATIKELSAGKSAVQNEIVGDLEKEFGSGPDDAAEMKLAELAGKFPDYASPGKVTSALIAKMLASKMPGGFGLSAIKEYLSSERCLPSSRIESVLLHGLTQNPKARLTDDATAKQWLDGVVDDYANYAGIDIPYLSKLGGMMAGPAMGQQVMHSSSLPSDFEKRLKTMIADQIDALNSYLGDDQLDWHRKIETEADMREDLESSVSQWVTEHGEFYGAGIAGKFDAKKERQYDSYWNWAVQDAMDLYHRTAATNGLLVSEGFINTFAIARRRSFTTSEDLDSDEVDSGEDEEASHEESTHTNDAVPTGVTRIESLGDALRRRAQQESDWHPVALSSSSHYRMNGILKKIVLPHVHVRKPSDVDPTIRLYDVESTCVLLSCMREMASTGISFAGKVALLTGCGKNSIGAEIVKALLEGGATVFVTTSSFSMKTTGLFREIYEQHGSRGSRLIVLPFNQASKVDVQSLVAHIYNVHKLDLDFVIPFAALSEVGRTITDIDSRSELAHRIMLTNTVRLLGEVVTAKKARDITTRPALVILPMSPNHGNFGGDGLYAESKLGVESLMGKWYSEGWDDQLSIVGAIIGWTRGTGLMSGNNVVAAGVEKMGMRTFSTTEMGFNLSVLMHPKIAKRAAQTPIIADLTGGMAQVAAPSSKTFAPRANMSSYYCNSFPKLSGVAGLSASKKQAMLRGMLDLRQVVVITGFGEVSPWGNSRTRWEMESYGEFSLEGCIELAWLTGRIVFDKGNWVDAKTKEIVPDNQNPSGAWMIRLRKGSVLNIPRALNFDRFVAGQIPTGWSAELLGLSKDLAESVDPTTLYALAATMDTFVAAGVTDPYEFYQYVHVSEVGNTSGGGMGGMRAFTQIYKNRLLGKAAPSDALQECFINTPPAWVNMLLLSSSGPIKTPVGACATALSRWTLVRRRSRVARLMKATSDSVKEAGMGREPKEMCRPCSTTRGGFMESHGAGFVGELEAATLLEVEYRRRQFDDELESIEKWYAREKALIDGDESRVAFLERRKLRKVQAAQATWGNDFYHGEADIAPLRGALSVWNLDIDDVGAASFHGTGTTANDKNESEVTHKQMAHLGRSPGNPLPVICQKNLTGHPKGAAAAWMLNGLLQVLNSGLIPGNRQLDNTCETLRKYDHLVYPNRSFQTVGVKAVMMKSFGFGQAGGEVLLVHPDYLLSTLPADEFQHYSASREQRLIKMNTHTQGVITGKHSHIQVKNEAPYSSTQESNVYLDPTARAEYDATSKTWPPEEAKAAAERRRLEQEASDAHQADSSSTLLTAINQAATDLGLASKNMGMGVDVEPVATFENLNGREDFIRRNFTDQEMAYCYSAPHPAASFAGRWAAKEAVIKAISSSAPTEPNLWKGAGAPLREIEIFMTASGAPSVLLSGYPLQVFNRLGCRS